MMTLRGGDGDDILNGGSGADTAIFRGRNQTISELFSQNTVGV